MRSVHPVKYFAGIELQESNLIQLVYDLRAARVELTIDYTAQILSDWFLAQSKGMSLDEFTSHQRHHRDLRRLAFGGVLSFTYKPQKSAMQSDVLVRQLSRPIICPISKVEVTPLEPGRWLLRMGLEEHGSGRVSFSFSRLQAERRLGKQVRGAVYRDVRSSALFDIRKPFDQI